MAYAEPSDFWQDFGVDNLDHVECSVTSSLAADVLRTYGIDHSGSEGGALSNLDIKHMDALSVIKMSLMEQSAEDGVIYEPMVNEYGQVEFNAIGKYSGNVNDDKYYEIQTGTYSEPCVGVLVTGGKPLPFRRELEWKPIWATEDRKEIYDMVNMDTNCMRDDFNRYCTIVFPDPHLETEYEDGIDNLYEKSKEKGNVYDAIMGYARYIDYPDKLDSPELTIEKNASATIPIEIGIEDIGGAPGAPSVGTLQKHPEIIENPWDDPSCYEGTQETANWEDGIEVKIPDTFRFENVRETVVDKFTRISAVYVIGMLVDYLASEPITNAAAFDEEPSQGSINRIAYVNATVNSVYKLDEGTHYVVAYDDSNLNRIAPYIVFSANSRKLDPADYGNDTTIEIVGGDYTTVLGGPGSYTGTILPIAKTKGFIVRQIFAMVDLETPCINIFHPDGQGNKAREIAENLEYLVAPLILVEEPPPIAYNGRRVDQEQGIRDHDPTTAQNLEDTEMDNIMDEMDGGGMTVAFSFLDGGGDSEAATNQVERLSNTLYDYMNSGDGVAATYICGPNADPKLGGTGGGDSKTIVNSITYSYNDSNSYTISVSTGPKLVGGFGSVTGGPSYKQADSDMSIKGTVIQDMGNHLYYKVRLDGYGDRVALNCCPKVIRVGDKVMCSIHNNPAEL